MIRGRASTVTAVGLLLLARFKKCHKRPLVAKFSRGIRKFPHKRLHCLRVGVRWDGAGVERERARGERGGESERGSDLMVQSCGMCASGTMENGMLDIVDDLVDAMLGYYSWGCKYQSGCTLLA
jgi:hypothetical protein